MQLRIGKNQQEWQRIDKNVTLTSSEVVTTVLRTKIIKAWDKNIQESFEHSKTFLDVPEHMKNIQQHTKNKQRPSEKQQETCRIFPRTGKCLNFEFLGMILEVFLTVGRTLNNFLSMS